MDSAPGADAVLYLMRHLHTADVGFLRSMSDEHDAGTSPVNAVGVLSRADEIAGGREDSLEVAGRIAAQYAADARVRALVQTVVSVSGLLALASTGLQERQHAAVVALADAPTSLLLSADRLLDAQPGPGSVARGAGRAARRARPVRGAPVREPGPARLRPGRRRPGGGAASAQRAGGRPGAAPGAVHGPRGRAQGAARRPDGRGRPGRPSGAGGRCAAPAHRGGAGGRPRADGAAAAGRPAHRASWTSATTTRSSTRSGCWASRARPRASGWAWTRTRRTPTCGTAAIEALRRWQRRGVEPAGHARPAADRGAGRGGPARAARLTTSSRCSRR